MATLHIMLLGFIGFIAYKLLSFKRTGKQNINSPFTFDWQYWLSDRGNWNDMLLGFVLFGVIAKYNDVLFSAFADNFLISFLKPYQKTDFLYIAIGFLMTFIIKLLRNLIEFIGESVKRKNKE